MNRRLWALIAAGTALKLTLAFLLFGNGNDIPAVARWVGELIDGDPFDIYADLPSEPLPALPYPPGFLPFAVLSEYLARALPGPFHGWVHVAPIAADAAIAAIVHRELGRRGQPERVRLAGAALVALGPVFAMISGYAWQLDSVAVLPVLVGVLVWDARRTADRALVAGLLIGLGATVKSPLGLAVLALLPSARSAREAATVALAAITVPLAALAPFLAVDASATLDHVLGYRSLAGQAMLSAVVDPDVTPVWLAGRGFESYHSSLEPVAPLLLAAIVALVLGVGLRFRPPAVGLAVVLWLAVWAFGSGFLFHYLIWGIPFLLVAGRVREAAVLQAFGFVALLALATGPHGQAVVTGYRIWVYALLAFALALLVRSVRAMRPA